MGLLRRLSSGLLLGVVCTEIVPSTVLTIHEAEPVMVLAPILGIIISILVVRGIDLLSTVQSSPLAPHKHKLSLHLDDSREDNPLSTPLLTSMRPIYKSHEYTEKKANNGSTNGSEKDVYLPMEQQTATSEGSLGPALKLLVNCVLDGLVLGTSLVENFDSTGWSLSAAVTIETVVLGMSFTAGASKSSNHQKLGYNMIIALGFPVGTIFGLLLTEKFQFNTFFFLTVLGFTAGILMDIVLEDLMREVYLGDLIKELYVDESGAIRRKPSPSRWTHMLSETTSTFFFYIGFTWCLVSETLLE